MISERLITVMPPPEHPVAAAPIDWEAVRARYDIVVPQDFRELLATYGSGGIDDFVWLLNPASQNPNINFETALYFQSAYKVMQESFPEDYPRPSYPERGSFFPWAVTDNGDSFVWIVDGEDPNRWSVCIHSDDQGEEEIYELRSVDLLECLLAKEIRSEILPESFPSEQVVFSPA